MKFFVEKAAFLKALSHGQNIVEKKTTIPILSHILLEAKEDKLYLTTTDFDTSLQETIPGKVDVEGAVCVSAHLMHDIVRKLSDRSLVEIEANPDNNQIIVKSGRSRFELSYLLAKDFPQITQTELQNEFVLTKAQLKEVIDQTEASMCINDSRFNVCALLMHSVTIDGKPKLRFVSTDYHRMACVELDAP
ncbi:MAG: DNA polymerase III subunit beta, partial [Alphaproteobacteria bacterium]|nr:DNA polymerase III subunit beta [Alphaproteobacteria bacterium]